MAELILEKIPISEIYFLLRKELFRFPTGVSFCPAIKINLLAHFIPPFKEYLLKIAF